MRIFLPLSIVASILASCSSSPVQLDANRCWSVSYGDEVKGTAMLLARKPDNGIIAGGASVSGRGCPGIDFAVPAGAAARAYDHIVETAPIDQNGLIRQVVYLSGRVILNSETGAPMIRADHLRLADQQ